MSRKEMIKMEIVFLGTSAAEGWPGVFCSCRYCERARELGGRNVRTRSSVVIDRKFLIDLTPDTYLNSLRFNIDLSKIRYLFVTHSHQDHFYPQELYMRGEPFAHLPEEAILEIFGNYNVIKTLEEKINCERTKIRLHRVSPFERIEHEDFTLVPLLADHSQGEEALVFIIKIGEKTIFYGHDSGWYPEATWEYLKDFYIDLAIFDCTFGGIDQRKGHMGIQAIIEAKGVLEKSGSIDPRSICVATHFSHNGGLLYDELVERLNPYGFLVAYDGMVLHI